MKNLEAAPSLDQKSDELREDSKRAAEGQRTWTQRLRQNSRSSVGEDNELDVEFVAWRKEYNQWLKTGAQNHSGLNEIETKVKS